MEDLTAAVKIHEEANKLLEAIGMDHLTFDQELAQNYNWKAVCPLLSAKTQNAFSQNSHFVRFAHPVHDKLAKDDQITVSTYKNSQSDRPVPSSIYNLSVIEVTDVNETGYFAEMLIHAINQHEYENGFPMGDRDIRSCAYVIAHRFMCTIAAENMVGNKYNEKVEEPKNYKQAAKDESDGIDVRFVDNHTIQVKINGAGKKNWKAEEKVNVTVKP